MKTILLCIITSVFFVSCSAEEDFSTVANLSAPGAVRPEQYPANTLNPFDARGKAVYDALHLYYQDHQTPNSVSALSGQIRHISAKVFRSGSQTGRLIPFTDEMVESIMENPDENMLLIVQNSALQVYAKNNLITFLQHLIVKRQEEFSVIYDYITNYEQTVLNDAVFSAEERETILTVASISRYSLYSAEERKDRDWETNVGGKSVRSFFESNEMPIISIIALLSKVI
ncbi:hypothetical protein [Flavobacterium sp. LAR06]|uniref:hypothetical protein n=1 Tax=Flavobacterium sp. LAR06 TaxID=3064897 RepID=UPI0035C19BAB